MARMARRSLVLRLAPALIVSSVASAQRSGELIFNRVTVGFFNGYVVPMPTAQFVFFQVKRFV
jgi:hypothetical protein